jgi:hypothetical protein
MEVAVTEQRPKPRRGQGRPFVAGVSGNPKGRAAIKARAAELFATMAPDFGKLSATDEVLLRQAALLIARSERTYRKQDAEAAIRMSSEARRLLSSLRRRDRERESAESLTEYLAVTYPEYGADEARPARKPGGKGGYGNLAAKRATRPDVAASGASYRR